MEQNTAKGSGFLKVTGILMIIGGAISLIMAIIAIVSIAALAAMGASSGILYFAGILVLVSAAIELVAGIMGVKNCKSPEKANTCLVFGILVIALSVLGNIINVAGGASFNVASFLVGLVLPVLYIIGAIKNKGTSTEA